jgi:hypothetical protein
VIANPSGTATPSGFRLLIISPSEAFFPPTFATSSEDIWLKDFMNLFIASRGDLK